VRDHDLGLGYAAFRSTVKGENETCVFQRLQTLSAAVSSALSASLR
jgi:hypothetical protein